MLSFRPALLLVVPLLAAALSAPAAADVKDGVDAWQRGDYPAAVAEWRPLALAGDGDAQFNLGQAYKLGRGVPADLGQAEVWYRKAAKQGHLQAADNLGLVLFTANRRSEAMPFILQSAARGEPRAQYVLGTAHFNGDLAARDWPRAYALTKRASDAGLDIASARLAQLDQLIPLDQRQRGLAMLPEIEKEEQRARLAAVHAAAPPSVPPAAASPVKTASVPVSVPGAQYTPPPVVAQTAPAASPVPSAPVRAAPPPSSPAARVAAVAAAEAAAEASAAVAQPGTSYAAPPASRTEATVIQDAREPARAPALVPGPAPAPARVAASPWRAQVGAFAVEANARRLWASLAKSYPMAAEREPHYISNGKITRLQAGGFVSKAEAEHFCASLRQGGQACLVTTP